MAQSQNDLEIARIRAATLGLDANQFDAEEADFRHLIRSPITGKIIHSDLTEGKFVEAFEHLFEIVNLDEVWVKVQVLEKDIQHLAIGQRVELTLHDRGEPFDTQIDRIDVALDPQGQVCWAWATLDGANVMPGQVGSAKIQTSFDPERLSVPLRSVYSDGLQSYVLVEEASTKTSAEYRKRNVKLGRRMGASTSGGPQPSNCSREMSTQVIVSSLKVATNYQASSSWESSNSVAKTEQDSESVRPKQPCSPSAQHST